MKLPSIRTNELRNSSFVAIGFLLMVANSCTEKKKTVEIPQDDRLELTSFEISNDSIIQHLDIRWSDSIIFSYKLSVKKITDPEYSSERNSTFVQDHSRHSSEFYTNPLGIQFNVDRFEFDRSRTGKDMKPESEIVLLIERNKKFVLLDSLYDADADASWQNFYLRKTEMKRVENK